jgi:hypothetical protein
MAIEISHNPGVPQGDHPGIHINPPGVFALVNVDGGDGSPVLIYTVFFKLDFSAPNQFDEAVFGDITPVLAIFWAVDGV